MTRRKNTIFRGLAAAVLAFVPVFGSVSGADDAKKMQEDGRRIAADFMKLLLAEVRREMEATGPIRSILVCKFYAPEVASTLSRQTGWRVSRVSLKARNPSLGYPDSWEQKVLAEFDQRVARGEKADNLEHWEIVREPRGEVFRYMKALPVGPVCLNCHGPEEKLPEAVRLQLKREYPHDAGTGYSLGQVRGAVTIKRPLWQESR